MKLTPEQETEALQFFSMIRRAVREIAQDIGEKDITKVDFSMAQVFDYEERERLR